MMRKAFRRRSIQAAPAEVSGSQSHTCTNQGGSKWNSTQTTRPMMTLPSPRDHEHRGPVARVVATQVEPADRAAVHHRQQATNHLILAAARADAAANDDKG